MPNTNESFDQVEAVASPEHAVNVVKFESAQSDSAPRRRRGGRRVVRGVGAAGASLELKVEEHAATPLFEEPKLPVAQPAHDAGDVAVSSDDGDSDGVSRPTRRRHRSARPDDDVREIADEQSTRTRRRAMQVEDERDEDRPRRRRRSVEDADEYDEMPRRRRRSAVDDFRDEESFEERALDAVDMLPEGHEVRHNPRPMMSLLFQEPVLPSAADSRDRSDDDRDDSRESRNDRNMQDHDDAQGEDRPTRRRRRRNRDVAGEERSEDNRSERNERDNRNDDAENDEEGGSRKSRRSRRLNAQERRAAAEVEQIEEDLILDDITYAPIDDETRGNRGDDDDEQPTRTRRRRRGHGSREEADATTAGERRR